MSTNFWNIQLFQNINLYEVFSYASHVRFVEKFDSTKLKLMKKQNKVLCTRNT